MYDDPSTLLTMSWQELKEDQSHETGSKTAIDLILMPLKCLLLHTIQNHLLNVGTAHIGLPSLTPNISQENTPQVYPKSNMIKKITQLRFSSVVLVCVKLTNTIDLLSTWYSSTSLLKHKLFFFFFQPSRSQGLPPTVLIPPICWVSFQTALSPTASPASWGNMIAWCRTSTSLQDSFNPRVSTVTEAQASKMAFAILAQRQASSVLYDSFYFATFMMSKQVPCGKMSQIIMKFSFQFDTKT